MSYTAPLLAKIMKHTIMNSYWSAKASDQSSWHAKVEMGAFCCRRQAKKPHFHLLEITDYKTLFSEREIFLLRGVWKTVTLDGKSAEVGVLLFKKYLSRYPDLTYSWIRTGKFVDPANKDNWIKDIGFTEFIKRQIADITLVIRLLAKMDRLLKRLQDIAEIHKFLPGVYPRDFQAFAKCLFDAVVEMHGHLTDEEVLALQKLTSLLYHKVLPINKNMKQRKITRESPVTEAEVFTRRKLLKRMHQDKARLGIETREYEIDQTQSITLVTAEPSAISLVPEPNPRV